MNHSTEVFLRIEAIFNEALEASAESRSVLIFERCGEDASLVREVESLLRASEAEAHLTASRRLAAETTVETMPERRRIGPYELDRLLGRGGMGAVYLAHRADGQFEQQVAIKLIDLPLATDLFRERFRQERQILAGLQHPYIARLLDGGISDEGDLYLAMEFVDGTPIHRFCEKNSLSIPQRLTLFTKVCEAVQFAHQNLVVHRDLKPDNILVAEDGTPRLLDFGTAKLVSPSLDKQEGDLTRQGFQSFTPQYASPEQVLGNPITTASDTYSLGVLFYLLLTGGLPYELKELTTAELMRVICVEPPRRPSAEVSSGRRLDADLVAILEKALRKEPQERYRTAEQLSADVQDYLLGRPVAARRGTFRYRAGKFIRRNRAGIAAAFLLAVTLIAGIAGVLWQARVANEERRRAEARSADLRQLSNSLLSELDEAIKDLPGSTGVQKLLVTRVLEHLDRMAKDAQGDRQTQLDLINAYTRLGEVQGNGYEQNLGDRTGALSSMGKALALAEPLAASNHTDQEALQALATAQEDRGEILSESEDIAGAVASMQAGVRTYDRLLALPGAMPAQFLEASAANETLGDVMGEDTGLADIAAALTAYHKAMDLDETALRLDPGFVRARRGIADMQFKIGNAELDADPASALNDFRIAMERRDALPQEEHGKLSFARQRALIQRKEAVALSELGEYTEAIPLFEQSVQEFQRLAASDPKQPKDVRALGDLKRALQDEASSFEYAADPELAATSGDRERNLLIAQHILEQGVATIQEILKQQPANRDREAELANVQVRIGTIEQKLHEPRDTVSPSKSALAALKDYAGKDATSSMVLDLADTAILTVEPASLKDLKLAVAWAERGTALTHRKAPAWMLSLAQAYYASGQIEKAQAIAAEGLTLLPFTRPGEPRSRIRKLLELVLRESRDPSSKSKR